MMKKLPIDLQNFKEIITDNYLYVDKTEFIYELKKICKFLFLNKLKNFLIVINFSICISFSFFINTSIKLNTQFDSFIFIKIVIINIFIFNMFFYFIHYFKFSFF